MQILYDHQAFIMQKFGGISRYFSALANGLSQYYPDQRPIKLLYSNNGYLGPENYFLPPKLGKIFLKKPSKLYLWNKRFIKLQIRRDKFNVFHPTYYNPYFIKYLKQPYVITVHDMIHELFPEFQHSNDHTSEFKRKVIVNANHVIVISESTKRDLQEILKIPDERISVIYHGHHPLHSIGEIHSNEFQRLPFPYILYVGERWHYKNFYRFLRSLAPIFRQFAEVRLVCAGGGDFGSSEKEFIQNMGFPDRILQLKVNDSQLASLYRNAEVFCYPSLYEGFGLPILEAFANKCPVAVSNTSCFPEVGGDAVAYFNPYNTEEMTNTIKNILEQKSLRFAMGSLGIERLKLFSEETCIKKTLEVYQLFT